MGKNTLIFNKRFLYLIFSLTSLRWVAASQRRQHRFRAWTCKNPPAAAGKFYSKVTWPGYPYTAAIPQLNVWADNRGPRNARRVHDLLSPRKKKRERAEKKEWREEGGRKRKAALSPYLFRRLPALCSSFWAELDRLPLAQEDPPSRQPSAGRPHWGHFIEVTLLCTT